LVHRDEPHVPRTHGWRALGWGDVYQAHAVSASDLRTDLSAPGEAN